MRIELVPGGSSTEVLASFGKIGISEARQLPCFQGSGDDLRARYQQGQTGKQGNMLVTGMEQVCAVPALAPEQTPNLGHLTLQRMSLVVVVITIIKHPGCHPLRFPSVVQTTCKPSAVGFLPQPCPESRLRDVLAVQPFRCSDSQPHIGPAESPGPAT